MLLMILLFCLFRRGPHKCEKWLIAFGRHPNKEIKCTETYDYRTLFGFDKFLNPTIKEFKFPMCCSCVLT